MWSLQAAMLPTVALQFFSYISHLSAALVQFSHTIIFSARRCCCHANYRSALIVIGRPRLIPDTRSQGQRSATKTELTFTRSLWKAPLMCFGLGWNQSENLRCWRPHCSPKINVKRQKIFFLNSNLPQGRALPVDDGRRLYIMTVGDHFHIIGCWFEQIIELMWFPRKTQPLVFPVLHTQPLKAHYLFPTASFLYLRLKTPGCSSDFVSMFISIL